MFMIHSMNLNKFIDYNQYCPLCNKKLTLYLALSDTMFLRAETLYNSYRFYKFFYESFGYDQFIEISFKNDSYTLYINDFNLIKNAHNSSFFFVCNEDSINLNFGQFKSIDLMDSCYVRVSQDFELINNQLNLIDPNQKDFINSNEYFSYIKNKKIYFLEFNYGESKMRLSILDMIANKSIFSNELELPTTRPDFSDKEKIIDMFELWMLMS